MKTVELRRANRLHSGNKLYLKGKSVTVDDKTGEHLLSLTNERDVPYFTELKKGAKKTHAAQAGDELSPQQRAAKTRKANKAKKAVEKAAENKEPESVESAETEDEGADETDSDVEVGVEV